MVRGLLVSLGSFCAAGAVLMPGSAFPAGDPIAEVLQDDRFAAVTADPASYRLQIVLGEVVEAEGKPRLVQHTYRAGAEYFYPASAIKLCAAVAAMEELAALRASTGLDVDVSTPLVYHPLFDDEELESTDASNLDGGYITAERRLAEETAARQEAEQKNREMLAEIEQLRARLAAK